MFANSLTELWVVWGCITGVLVILLIYRSLVGTKEDDQLFLDPANPVESQQESEQKAIQSRLNKLGRYVKGFGFASGTVLVLIAGIWIYQAVVAFNNPGGAP